MAYQLLTELKALEPGSKLWIVPDPKSSSWCTRLDWYMNFQISRMLRHKSATPTEGLLAMAEASGLAIPQIHRENFSPLLFATRRLLPNEWTLCQPYKEGLKKWTTELEAQLKDMDAISVRVFFPSGINSEEAEQWAKKNGEKIQLTYLIES